MTTINNFLNPSELAELKRIEEEINYINDHEDQTDGQMYQFMRLMEKKSSIIEYAKHRKIFEEHKISFEQIPGGFIIQSPKFSYRRYYYYPQSKKWRQEGKSKYYFCKNTDDLINRFILNINKK